MTWLLKFPYNPFAGWYPPEGWERPDWWTEDYDTAVITQQQAFDTQQQEHVSAATQQPIVATKAPTAAVVTSPAQKIISVQIPQNATPGQAMKVTVEGKQFQFTVPPGTTPGAIIQINIGL